MYSMTSQSIRDPHILQKATRQGISRRMSLFGNSTSRSEIKEKSGRKVSSESSEKPERLDRKGHREIQGPQVRHDLKVLKVFPGMMEQLDQLDRQGQPVPHDRQGLKVFKGKPVHSDLKEFKEYSERQGLKVRQGLKELQGQTARMESMELTEWMESMESMGSPHTKWPSIMVSYEIKRRGLRVSSVPQGPQVRHDPDDRIRQRRSHPVDPSHPEKHISSMPRAE